LATVARHAAGSGIRAVVNPGFAAGAVRTIAVEALKPLDRCAPIPSPPARTASAYPLNGRDAAGGFLQCRPDRPRPPRQ
jgi:hypothetical protein